MFSVGQNFLINAKETEEGILPYAATFLLPESSLFSSLQKELEQNYVVARGIDAENIILHA